MHCIALRCRYDLAQSEAVCRLGREMHLFRSMGKLVKVRASTTEVASEWVTAVAVAGAQFSKDDVLHAQSQLVLQAYVLMHVADA